MNDREHAPGTHLTTSKIDGLERQVNLEHNLNLLAARLFSTGGGLQFIEYLQSITITQICGPGASDQYLRHLEGARWLYGIIMARVKQGQRDGARTYEPERPENFGA